MQTRTGSFSFLGVVVLAGMLGLGGCSSDKTVAPQLVAETDNVSLMLANAADKASSALQTLAAIEQTRGPAPNLAPIPGAPPELQRGVTVSWIGPVQSITQLMAERASYGFEMIGAAPGTPVVVSLDVENKPIIDILRDIGLQLNNRGKLVVDSNRRVVELQFSPPASG